MTEPYIRSLSVSESVKRYNREYCSLIVFYLAMDPLSCLFDNMLMSDGEEKLSAAANIIEIVSNILLSLLFADLFGIQGIAWASIASKLLFFAVISRKTLRRIRSVLSGLRPKLRIWKDILSTGVVRASKGFFMALTDLALIMYFAANFEQGSATLVSVALRMLGSSSMFIGLSMAAQPLITTLHGERNTWALRSLMKNVSKTMFLIGIALSLFTILFAPFLIRGFGIKDPSLLDRGTVMMRYMGLSFAFMSLTTLYFVYAFLMRKNRLALLLIAMNEFMIPVTAVLIGGSVSHSLTGTWIGIAVAPLIGFLLSMLIVRMRYGKENFPWLVTDAKDKDTKCYDLEITEENDAALSETLIRLLDERGCSQRTGKLAGMLAEDMLLLIKEKNPPEKKILAECNVIFEGSDVRILLRDNGCIFDIMNCDGTQSLHGYIVAQTLTLPEYKFYISAMGYNRNESLFRSGDKSEGPQEG